VTKILDDAGALKRSDTGGMLAAIETLPAQLSDAWRITRELDVPERHGAVHSVALLGMGGSAIGGDLVRSVFADRLTLPLTTVRDYELPAWVGRETLVVGASYSGATEETVNALATALERRAPVVIMSTGGPLHDVAQRAGLPLLAFPGGGQPRAAVGYATTLLAGLLERVGALPLDEAEIERAADAVRTTLARCAPDVPTEENPAKQLAWSILDRLPVVFASGSLAPVARRWKTQLNENGKTMAAYEELPEATHNTVVGFAQPEALHERMYVVFLESANDHPRNGLRASLTAELLAISQIPHQVVPVGGEGRLAQAFAAITLGDLVSVYLAFLYGLDPTPVEAIGLIKQRMATPEDDAED
jgi:glucose/mannose-6-phosphate isomerase